jgi:hypothetical protein
MVQDVAFVAGVHWQIRTNVIVANACDTELCSQGLQFAVAVLDAHSANVIALGQKQFDHHLPVFDHPVGLGANHHAFGNGSHAGGKQPGASFHLYNAQATPATLAQPLEMAEGGHFYPLFLYRTKKRDVCRGAYKFIVNRECDN